MIRRAIERAVEGRDLSETEMMEVMEEITEGRATPVQIGAFLVGLRAKGETVDEITGAARILRAKSALIPLAGSVAFPAGSRPLPGQDIIVDTCGTGGDGQGTFNVSTATAFVAAGAGLKVAKHGNRAISSRCGSADVLEALGVGLDLGPEQVGECLDRVGICFLFAPRLHASMRHATEPRKEIGLRTIFNLLGPLTNPIAPTVQVVGVYRADLTETMASVLARLGCRSGFVVHGLGGYDEITITGPSVLTRLNGDGLETMTLTPEDVGLTRARPEEIAGGETADNAAIVRNVLDGGAGACRDMVLLNAAAVMVAAGLAGNFSEGVEVSAQVIDSGRARAKLEALVAAAARVSPGSRVEAA